ncbi:Hypothetical protein A7982_01860 [Minicystis rosea]|nr:Hypothetical protein A7982_01860 [Minicystis rosea]
MIHRPLFGKRGAAHAGACLLIAATVGAASAASCTVVGGTGGSSSSSSSSGVGGSGGSGGAMGTGGSNPVDEARALFESTVQPGMLTECGSCHKLGGISDKPFLSAPDIYVSITTWPNVIVDPPSLSVILTHPPESSHGGGQAPDLTKDLREKTTAWLEFEAKHLPKPDGGGSPLIAPFKPYLAGAFNAIYLDSLGPDFANCSITFNAEQLPQGSSKPTLLRLTNLEVHPVAGVQIHVVHPLFTVYPTGVEPIPDPADSFSGFDNTYSLDTNLTFGTGELILSSWAKDARISIAFEKIEAIKSGGPGATCKNVAKFQAEVVPQLKMWPCYSECHSGPNIMAQQQMDLANLDAMPPDDACAQVRARITPGEPDKSQILQVTDPAYMGIHGFKFQGNKNNYNSFKAAVTPWILAEQ